VWETHKSIQKGVWFLCRYGSQRYPDVMAMTIPDILRGAKILAEFIEAEAPSKHGPKPPSGGAA
jgi:hypothetical protein